MVGTLAIVSIQTNEPTLATADAAGFKDAAREGMARV